MSQLHNTDFTIQRQFCAFDLRKLSSKRSRCTQSLCLLSFGFTGFELFFLGLDLFTVLHACCAWRRGGLLFIFRASPPHSAHSVFRHMGQICLATYVVIPAMTQAVSTH